MTTNPNKVSQNILNQLPDFIKSEHPAFEKFLEYYYKSQEKTGQPQNILNQLTQYLDIDSYDFGLIQSKTSLLEDVSANSDIITVESVDDFLENDGSLLINDEIVYYERADKSPEISLTDGVSYQEFREKWIELQSPYMSFNGVQRSFPLRSENNPVAAPSPDHVVVRLYGQYQIPNVDFVIDGTNIIFTDPPRSPNPSDSVEQTAIFYLKGFLQDPIEVLDDISSQFNSAVTEFIVLNNGIKYNPVLDIYLNIIVGGRLLTPFIDFTLVSDGVNNILKFKTAPTADQGVYIASVEAPISSFGSGASAVAQIGSTGELSGILVKSGGSNYRIQYPPNVDIVTTVGGGGAAAYSLVNGIKSLPLLGGGAGYSDLNPPIVDIEVPTAPGGISAKATAIVENGSVVGLNLEESGSNFTFTPRVTFKDPGGCVLANPSIDINGSLISDSITIESGGVGYTIPPTVYIDAPTGPDPIQAELSVTITDGTVTGYVVTNRGRGYLAAPRVAVIDPGAAQILDVIVDATGRVIDIDLLSGGSGYVDIPSIYIVDNRKDASGAYIGGVGATAVASIFNGQITDLNITNFGTGYDPANPPRVVIQRPPSANASAEVGFGEVTGFRVVETGSAYTKAQFVGCSRGVSGIVGYDSDGNVIYENNTVPAVHSALSSEVQCLDGVFIEKMLSKFTEQYLPDIPKIDLKKININTVIKNIRTFYASKGTRGSIQYLFKILYGENVSVTYPKEQIIKPSAASWQVDTILRCIVVSGDPRNLQDGLLEQFQDQVDPNIGKASALIENFISIKTSELEIFELVLSEETIEGSFTIPYKTKLAEAISTTDSVITVDSTIGWPERNGEILIGTELIRYKEKSLNQFIECTRSVNGIVEDWDAATEVSSNFYSYVNYGQTTEVVVSVVGIIKAENTQLTDDGTYYLPGDKLTVSKLGATETTPLLNTWNYNVKKLVSVDRIEFGGVSNRTATVYCNNPHGLLVGDQVTIYGANPILFNGTYFVQSRESTTVFKYQLAQPAATVPQGNILISVDLNRGKSDLESINNVIKIYTTNIQNAFFNDDYVYIAASGIPNYKIGPFAGQALIPGNQRKLLRFPRKSQTISTKDVIQPGPIGSWVNGVSIWSYKSDLKKVFGKITAINIVSQGESYDAASPPALTISGGGGSDASGSVVINGSITDIDIDSTGSNYSEPPLVSIVGGGGSGASATAVVTNSVVSRILINSSGTGYTSKPEITIVGGGGSGATATASIRGPISSVNITNVGTGYTSEPTVTLSSGSGAQAQAIVQNGRIISIAVINAGSGYTTPPEVEIYGTGFGAIAKANIDTDGENAGRVTSISLSNKGINYESGTTVIILRSVGSAAQFQATVQDWTYNLALNTTLDDAEGSVFSGYNNQYGGEYAHFTNPKRLRFVLGDNLLEDSEGNLTEATANISHSPIIGWAFDGNPIYGPYGYSDPTNQSSNVRRLEPSYQLESELVYDVQTNPSPIRTGGPLLSESPAGTFVEDYEYTFGQGDLDRYNGRFGKTPEYPDGVYSYFVCIDSTAEGNSVYPYIIGPTFNSSVDVWNLRSSATQQNIPTGVIRYRDPYENVDIDVERQPNATADLLTTEDGLEITFEPIWEDADGDNVIDTNYLTDDDGDVNTADVRLSVRPDDRVFRLTYDQNTITMEVGQTYSIPAYTTTNQQYAASTSTLNFQVLTNGITSTTVLGRIVSVENFNPAFDGTYDQYIGLNFSYTDEDGVLQGTANISDIEYVGFRATNELTENVAEELQDVGSLLEENKLELFDYFPKVRFDSKVDIEVETITKFEDAKVNGFVVENPGDSYQVDDRLIFDDEETGGYGISATIKTIQGKTVSSYNTELIDDVPHGVVQTSVPHELSIGDRVEMLYEPQIASENRQYKVKVVNGVERVVVTQTGTGYNDDVPITVEIDGDGQHADIQPIINTSNGTVSTFNIKKSGNGFSENPRLIISHPQEFKKSEYFIAGIQNLDNTVINATYTSDITKEIYVCGNALDQFNNRVGFVAKYSPSGDIIWQKTARSEQPSGADTFCDFKTITVDESSLSIDVYVAGTTKPNALNVNYNPDIVLMKFNQNSSGSSVSIQFQKELAGISGSTRLDEVTSICKVGENKWAIGGHTNTNSTNPFDAFLIIFNENLGIQQKRKISTASDSEKVNDIVYNPDNNKFYVLLEIAPDTTSATKSFAIATCEAQQFALVVDSVTNYNTTGYNCWDSRFDLDEFGDFFVSGTSYSGSNPIGVFVGKVTPDGGISWGKRITPAGTVRNLEVVGGNVDVFGNYNIAINYEINESTSTSEAFRKQSEVIKFKYDGSVVSCNKISLDRNIVGFEITDISADSSGDPVVMGQGYSNEVIALFDFEATSETEPVDTTGNITNRNLIGDYYTGSNIASGSPAGVGSTRGLRFDAYDGSAWSDTHFEINPGNDAGIYGYADTFDPNGDWTIEGFYSVTETTTLQDSRLAALGSTHHTLMTVGDGNTPGVVLQLDRSDKSLKLYVSATTTRTATPIASSAGIIANDSGYVHIAVTKSGNLFTMYADGSSVGSGSLPTLVIPNTVKLYVGNVPNWTGAATGFTIESAGSFDIDGLRITDKVRTIEVPSVSAEFNEYYKTYHYTEDTAIILKTDKNIDGSRQGTFIGSNSNFHFTTAAYTYPTTINQPLTVANVTLASEGLQVLDYNDVNSSLVLDSVSLTSVNDIWSSRTATVPALGGKKVKATTTTFGKFYIKVSNTVQADNVLRLTLNQTYNLNVGSVLTQSNSAGQVLGTATIIDMDTSGIYIAQYGSESTWQGFEESGEITSSGLEQNDIASYQFSKQPFSTTQGTFIFDIPSGLDARFKNYAQEDFSVRIDDTAPAGSPFIIGSVITPNIDQVTYNADRSQLTISGLTAVTEITLVTNLDKILQIEAVSNTDKVFIKTDNAHRLSVGDNLFITGNADAQFNGSFSVSQLISSREYAITLRNIATTTIGAASIIEIFTKHPVLQMFYQHKYQFMLGDPSLEGYFFSFSKDNLFKLEYSFNSIQRVGTPGIQNGSDPEPYVQLSVANDVTNISYYFDPSRTGDTSPVDSGTYLDVITSPYAGNFIINRLDGATITSGATIFKFPLLNETESDASSTRTTYETYSKAAAGPIGDIRLINGGGFYTKLPVISSIVSNRKIERVEITEPGTEYALGEYTGIDISGDGEGGKVNITVEDGTDAEGGVIPGQISRIVVTDPGKGYTTAFIDIESVPGILGSSLAGSGADLNVIIPPNGSGASVFVKANEIGKIKKLKNNNFGFDYTHDYTLRPEITFPVNVQLTSTSILDSITVTDPGSGYATPPTVEINGGGGTGATAEATIRNGRIDQIEVKDPGSGYSSEPTVSLKSQFNYVVNLDLNLLQFSFPHGINPGAAVTVSVSDDGSGVDPALPISSFGRLNGNTTYYAISGISNSLEDDQLRLSLTADNAAIGDFISFTNTGDGRQLLLTDSFGGGAAANVVTGRFLAGEYVYQGETQEQATAYGYVSNNDGWQEGPRILKIVDYTGTFTESERLTGTISKASGTIDNLSIARGVLEVGSITSTPGRFVDDVGKPSEIIQKIQDSYFYQDFSYSVQAPVSISDWREILTTNVHPAGFKVFGELGIVEKGTIENKTTSFELTKSVNLAESAIVPNLQNFTLVEPVYTDFDNTEVRFRQKNLTSSEQILTSTVQKINDISQLFDGERISFPLEVENRDQDGNPVTEPVIAAANQLIITLNGIVQSPEEAFTVQGSNVVFAAPPQPPANVQYATATLAFKTLYRMDLTNISGIFPLIGGTIRGVVSDVNATVVAVGTTTIDFYYDVPNSAFQIGENIFSGATGFSGDLATISNITAQNLFQFKEEIANLRADTATIEEVNLEGNNGVVLTTIPSGLSASGTTFDVADGYALSTVTLVNPGSGYFDDIDGIPTIGGSGTGLTVEVQANGDGTVASILIKEYGTGYNIGETVTIDSGDGNATFTIDADTTGVYQIDAERFTVVSITGNTVIANRGADGTAIVGHQTNSNLFGTTIEVGNKVVLSKTAGTYQSTPGIFDIVIGDIIIGQQSGIVAEVTGIQSYRDPVTGAANNQVIISEGSSFFGIVFNRITSIDFQNVVLDNISQTQLQLTDLNDSAVEFNSKFPNAEAVSNLVIEYENATGEFALNEQIRNNLVNYSNLEGDLDDGETIRIYKLSYNSPLYNADGLILSGDRIRTENATAEVIGTNYARGYLYLGKVARRATDLHVPVAGNGAIISSLQKKFGSGSLYLNGTAYVDVASSSDFAFSNNDFTIEAQIYANSASLTGTATILDFRTAGTQVAVRLYLENGQLRYNVNGSDLLAAGSISQDTWTSVAITRASNTIKMFIDGAQVANGNDANTHIAKPIKIGADYANANEFTGYIDEIRVSSNARYTAAYTPETGMFQGDANTELLLHFDGENLSTTFLDWSGAPTWNKGDEFVNGEIDFRFYDASNEIQSNRNLITNEAIFLLDRQFPQLHIPLLAEDIAITYGAEFYSVILSNLDLIANEAYEVINPSVPAGTTAQDCIDDVKDVIRNIAYNLKYGFNSKVWDAADLYVNGGAIQHLTGVTAASISVFNKARDIAKDIINNTAVTITGSHGFTQTLNNDIPFLYEGYTAAEDRITVLNKIVTDTLSDPSGSDSVGYPSSTATLDRTHPSYAYCLRDAGLWVDAITYDLRNTGNGKSWDAAANYVDRTDPSNVVINHVAGEEGETVWAVDKVRDFAISVMRGDLITITGDHGITQVVDETITRDSSSPYCANVASAITIYADIISDTIEQANLGTPVDHLGTVTRVSPSYPYGSGVVDAAIVSEFTCDKEFADLDLFVSTQLWPDSQNRFKDAATLIRANAGTIVDETAGDMLQRYPDLALDMPRNANGTSTLGTLRCKTDLTLLLSAIAEDIEFGGSGNTTTAFKFYLGAEGEIKFIRLQLLQSLYAHERLAFYAKAAIDGTLVTNYSDRVVIPPAGITNDPGGCADVKSAIDTLADLINETLAPTGDRFRDSGDLLLFNQTYIAEEAVGLMQEEFSYVNSGGITIKTFDYPGGDIDGKAKCVRDMEEIIKSIVSDLLVGGNYSSVEAAKLYLDSDNKINHVEDQIAPTVEAIERVGFLCKKAVNNLLQNTGDGSLGNEFYVPRFTLENAYTDDTITDSLDDGDPSNYGSRDCANVRSAIDTLIATIIEILAPGSESARSSNQQVAFGREYIDNELRQIVIGDWGDVWKTTSGTWVSDRAYTAGTLISSGPYIYEAQNTETSGSIQPVHTSGIVFDATFAESDPNNNSDPVGINWKFIEFSKTYWLDQFVQDALYDNITTPDVVSAPYQVETATYDPSSGDLVITSSDHGLTATDSIFITPNSLTFTCSSDNYNSYNTYPRQTDPAFKEKLAVTNPTTDTFTVNVGASPTVTYNVSVSGTSYDAGDGELVLNIGNHDLFENTSIKLADNSLTFTCSSDGNVSQQTYPRPGSDPFAGTSITISAVGHDSYDVDDATYIPSTGVLTMQVVGHPFVNGDKIRLEDESLVFTCDSDGDVTEHAYPRSTDPFSYKWMDVSNVIGDEFEVNVGVSPNSFVHTFKYALDRALDHQDGTITLNVGDAGSASGESHVFISATAGAVIAGGNYTHQFIESTPDAIQGPVAQTGFNNTSTIDSLIFIDSPVENESSSVNIWPAGERENFGAGGWTVTGGTISADSGLAPDNTNTADKYIPGNNTNNKVIERTYALPSYDTFDDDSITFDDTSNTFDEGANISFQSYTWSCFVKQDEFYKFRHSVAWSANDKAEFTWDAVTGAVGPSLFVNGNIIVGDNITSSTSFEDSEARKGIDWGVKPYGFGWFRPFITFQVPFGISQLDIKEYMLNNTGTLAGSGSEGDGTSGSYIWGAKLSKGSLDIYSANSGEDFYVSDEYNIKKFMIDKTEDFIELQLNNTQVSPAVESGTIANYDPQLISNYVTADTMLRFSNTFNLYREQLKNTEYWLTVPQISGITVPTQTYVQGNSRNVPIALTKKIDGADFFYGLSSDSKGEIEKITFNESTVAATYKRFKFNGDQVNLGTALADFELGEVVQTTGNAANTGTIYALYADDNFRYMDVVVTGGSFSDYDGLTGANAGTNLEGGTNLVGSFINLTNAGADVNRVQGSYTVSAIGSATGSGATFTVSIDDTGSANVVIEAGGTGYQAGDVLTLQDVDMGNGGGNNITLEVDTLTNAGIQTITNRLQVIDLVNGIGFTAGYPFKGYTSGYKADTLNYISNKGAVIDNTGGRLTLDTESLEGTFEDTSIIYPDQTRIFLDVIVHPSIPTSIDVGDNIVATGYTRLGVNLTGSFATLDYNLGELVYQANSNLSQIFQGAYGYVTGWDSVNGYLYVSPIGDSVFQNGFNVAQYPFGNTQTPTIFGQVSTTVNQETVAYGTITRIDQLGLSRRVYLADVVGTFTGYDTIVSDAGYKAASYDIVNIQGRTSRYFVGFDGTQTSFKLTENNGTPYFPDPEGHMMIFVNGILQPPGAAGSYSAFSDVIQFNEAPTLGSSFTGFYLGKMRQLDDISFEFDSLRSSFNLKRDGTFYSLALTEGVQETESIIADNNIIISLNGVIQEPDVGFELVGSRVIFKEIPRVGSTFVGFAYIGSDADVTRSEVVPPIESGDLLQIQGENVDREVAVIESANTLVTFEYIGSVFGRDAEGTANILKGRVNGVQVTNPGSGYTSRPTVRIDSSSGFDAEIKALVGVSRVDTTNPGSGYGYPEIDVLTSVPDDWTIPDITLYGEEPFYSEEIIDPEIQQIDPEDLGDITSGDIAGQGPSDPTDTPTAITDFATTGTSNLSNVWLSGS
ncbi:structural protein [Synechococcus phage ACG-2014d]|uniref:Structural protein n=1 Tax=Synechococcus phage ACG-2014d TaxID=1493509 RepID=A0A0E3F643_9CAUD|nr:structural protein [Synechococcus phage ACG-2014d]